VAGAKQELPQFMTRRGATPIEFVADFHPKCVVEFPWTARPVPTERAYFEFQVTTPVRQLSGRPPAYPPALLESHIDGRVLAQFVVDTSGVPDIRTLKILESSSPLFSAAVRDALPGLRFVPAKLEGRRVRQIVQQPFNFAVR
jgi:protein TonB